VAPLPCEDLSTGELGGEEVDAVAVEACRGRRGKRANIAVIPYRLPNFRT